jgi:tRNA nucleotidyltransferase/poly(A) polymerase
MTHPPASPVPAREAAIHVVRVLVESGHVAYFAGGCVRDRLMGWEPADYDVATDARPDDVRRLFRQAHSVGEAFGVMLVRHRGHVVEVATFRTDGIYSDGRRPDAVTFCDARHDALRRDFTINGLFEDPLADRIIDHVGGQADLKAKIIRAIGDPEARLREDRLRMLRAVRFAARFEFSIDADTAASIRRGAGGLDGVSRERIGQEVRRMLSHRTRAAAATEMQYLELDRPVLGEESRKVTPARLGRLAEAEAYPTALAAWLLDRHPVGSDQEAVVARWAERLVLSNAERGDLHLGLEVHRVLCRDWGRLGVARQKRLAASGPFRAGLALVAAEDREASLRIAVRVEDLARGGLAPAPLIDGSDLIALGLSPGPLFKEVLDAVYDAQLEGSVVDQGSALALARTIAEQVAAGGR